MDTHTHHKGDMPVAVALLAGFGLLLTGLGAGIALTLLLAPLSGADTRKLIGRKVKEGEGWVKDQAIATEDYVLAKGAHLRDRAKEMAEGMGRS